MLIRHKARFSEADVTSESAFASRRRFIKGTVAGAGLLALSPGYAAQIHTADNQAEIAVPEWLRNQIKQVQNNAVLSVKDTPAPFSAITEYNNFYEFGLSKDAPKRYAQSLKTDPWSVTVEGEAHKTGTFYLEDLVKPYQLEERIYPLRCVEAWSMVIPWLGIPLAELLKSFEPTGNAKYVEFTTLYDPQQMPGQRSALGAIRWPYVEGLRMDEAMHPLALMAVGLYGQALPPQNGAPMRLVVPWKYGFKSIKSIVKIRFTEQMPKTTWSLSAPREYGFYANVNPQVDHPRWTQKSERRLPAKLFSPNIIDTQAFNGYADQVAGLYSAMDLKKWF